MSGKVFISYRRDGGAANARSIYDYLAREFGAANVFMDVDKLLAGQRFDTALEAALSASDALLAIIDPRWLDALNERSGGAKADYVRKEISYALERGLIVVPVLVDRAVFPDASELTEDIRALALHQHQVVSHERFASDVEALIEQLIQSSGGRLRRTSHSRRRVLSALGLVIAAGGLGGLYLRPSLWQAGAPASLDGVAVRESWRDSMVSRLVLWDNTGDADETYVRIRARLTADTAPGAQAVPDLDSLKLYSDDEAAEPETTTKTSLYESIYKMCQGQNIPAALLRTILAVYVRQVDYLRPVGANDTIELLLTTSRSGGEFMAPVYVSLETSSTLSGYYRFTLEDGAIIYVDKEGRSSRPLLLRKPLQTNNAKLGAKISPEIVKGMGLRRDPITGTVKMHTGVDWVAPLGTVVVAAADGVVEEAGMNGAYGNFIKLRHDAPYSTAYAHLQSIGEGIVVGQSVKQGDPIGTLGATGKTSGPHLHYEVRKDEQYLDPLSITVPQRQLSGQEFAKFDALRKGLDRLLQGSLL